MKQLESSSQSKLRRNLFGKRFFSGSSRRVGDAVVGGFLAASLVVAGALYVNSQNHSSDVGNPAVQGHFQASAASSSLSNTPHLVNAAFPVPAPAPKSDSSAALIKEGKQLFQAHTCSACHGQEAKGTAIAPPLAGIGHYFNEATFSSLIHHPRPPMIDKGMPPAPLSDKQTHALWTYLNSMPVPAHRAAGVPAVTIFK